MERGLFRLWLVGSIGWVAVSWWGYSSAAETNYAPYVVGPPLVAAILVSAVAWVCRGFSR